MQTCCYVVGWLRDDDLAERNRCEERMFRKFFSSMFFTSIVGILVRIQKQNFFEFENREGVAYKERWRRLLHYGKREKIREIEKKIFFHFRRDKRHCFGSQRSSFLFLLNTALRIKEGEEGRKRFLFTYERTTDEQEGRKAVSEPPYLVPTSTPQKWFKNAAKLKN